MGVQGVEVHGNLNRMDNEMGNGRYRDLRCSTRSV